MLRPTHPGPRVPGPPPGAAASGRRVARPTPGCPSRPGGRARRGEAVPPRGERPKVGAGGGRGGARLGQALPADGVRLVGLRLRGAGGGGRRRGLRQGRQRPVSGRRAALRGLGGAGRLPAVQRSQERVAFPRGVWNLVCCYGDEILQLQKSNAWDNCWCQFADGWTAWIADHGKAS